MKKEERLHELLNLYNYRLILDDEMKELGMLLVEYKGASEDWLLAELKEGSKESALHDEKRWQMIMDKIHSKGTIPVYRVHFLRRFRWAAAAVFLLVAGSVYFLVKQKEQPYNTTVSDYRNDIAPGREGAKIKLSTGKVILIDTLQDGLIAMEETVEVRKENGKIVYKGISNEELYNEIIEDKGRYTSVQLPDGSTAWVNSGSSLRYPLRFSGNERRVTMTGRAAFLAVHDASKPFRVEAGGQEFEDKGTEFNIDAYADQPEGISMTVREGMVQVKGQIVKAGQQAQIGASGSIKLVNQVDADLLFAWRDNEFQFSNASIEEIMKEAARWYDIEVEYKGTADRRFNILGINRNTPISTLLHYLEMNGGVHFEVNGKRVIIKP